MNFAYWWSCIGKGLLPFFPRSSFFSSLPTLTFSFSSLFFSSFPVMFSSLLLILLYPPSCPILISLIISFLSSSLLFCLSSSPLLSSRWTFPPKRSCVHWLTGETAVHHHVHIVQSALVHQLLYTLCSHCVTFTVQR